ncbi:MAG: VOC family protein [Pseudomonadales bacterium]|nr:VOC family protein [Pseudomonadales bacterium]
MHSVTCSSLHAILIKQRLILALLLCCSWQQVSAASQERDEAVVQGVNYIGVTVADLDQATDLYSSAANLESVSESPLAESLLQAFGSQAKLRAETRLMRSVNAQLRFMQFTPSARPAVNFSPVPVNGPGIAHICYQVADETQSYQRFLQGGASHIGNRDPVQLNPRNPVVYAYAHDQDGIMFEVEHIDFSRISRPRKNDYRIRHVSISSPNIEPMVAFYSILMEEPDPRRLGVGGALSGLPFDQVSGLPGTRLEMVWFQVRNLELELIQYHSHPTELPAQPRPLDAPGYNLIMFDVVDLESTKALLQEAGATSITEPMSVDGGQAIFARDPDGNLLGFQQISTDSPFSSRNFADNGT